MASDRPHRWRIVHAVSHEVTVVAVTLPIMVWLGGLTIAGALMAVVYTHYAYVFHLVYDRWRPVGRGRANQTAH